jgi:hypothetical protein
MHMAGEIAYDGSPGREGGLALAGDRGGTVFISYRRGEDDAGAGERQPHSRVPGCPDA